MASQGVKHVFPVLGRWITKSNVAHMCRRKGSLHITGIRSMSTSKSLDIGGVYPPISTPFNASEDIDWDQLANNMQKYNKIGFKGYVVQGSNGEYVFLSPEERVQMVQKVRELAPKGKLIMAGSGCEYNGMVPTRQQAIIWTNDATRDTIEMSNKMADAGADCVLVVTPCYYKGGMTADAMLDHYTKVADACKVPVVLYSVPANTGLDLAADVIIKLSQHPNIIGLKESGGDISKIGSMLYATRDQDFQFLAGSAGFLLPALAEGCVGGVCALANILGAEVCELFNLHRQGKHEEARQLQLRLVAPNAAVTRLFNVPGLKATLDWYGYYGGPLRSPLQPLTAEQLAKVKAIFQASGFKP